MKTIIFSMLMIVSMTSCSILDSDKTELMNMSEELISKSPDSSLSLLRGIRLSELHSKSAKARYALLYTKAQHKCYDTIPNDSIINIAVEYYKKRGIDRDYGEALMYRGAALYDMMDYKEAMSLYKLAEDILEDGDDYELLALINSRIGSLHIKLYSDLTIAIGRYKTAASYYCRLSNKRNEGRAYNWIGSRYIFMPNKDSALFYLQKSLDIAKTIEDTNTINKNHYLLMLLHNNHSEYEDAINIGVSAVSQAIEAPLNIIHKLSRAYAKVGKIDSARMYLDKYYVDSKMNLTDYMTLAIIEEQDNNYNAALSHNKKVQVITDSILRQRRELELVTAEKRFDYQKVLTVNKVLKEKNKTRVTLGLLLISILIIVIIVFIIRANNKKRAIAEKDSFIEQLRAEHDVKENQFVKDLSKLDVVQGKLKVHLGKRFDALSRLMDISYRYGTNAPIFLREYNKIMNMDRLGKDILADICDVVNLKTNGLIDSLIERHPILSQNELYFLALVHSGFYSTAICALCSYGKPESVYVRKNRISNKMGLKEPMEKYLDWIVEELKKKKS